MIYVAHDFYSNFTNGVSSGDTDLSLNILKSELSDLIVYSFDKLAELFDKLKIKFSKLDSDEEVLHKVVTQIQTNDKFVRGLAFLINDNNDVIKNNPDKKWVDLMNKISDGIKKTAQELADNPKLQTVFEKDVLDMIALKADKIGNRTRTIKNKDYTLAWTIGFIAAGVAAYLIIQHFRNKKEHELYLKSLEKAAPIMEVGGNIDSMSPSIPNQVDVNAPVTNTVNPNVPVAPVVNPMANDPAFNVSPEVLIPANQAGINQMGNQVNGGFQQVSVATSMSNLSTPNNNVQSNPSVMQNNQTFAGMPQQNIIQQPTQNNFQNIQR